MIKKIGIIGAMEEDTRACGWLPGTAFWGRQDGGADGIPSPQPGGTEAFCGKSSSGAGGGPCHAFSGAGRAMDPGL